MKVVLDTKVLIAAFIASGVCSDLLEHCIRGHELATSEFILNEFHENMVRKFRYSNQESMEAVELLRLEMEVVTPVGLDSPVCRDPDDDTILGTALGGDAACIVTGDKDLLVPKQFGSVDIVSPAEFSTYEAVRQGFPHT